MKKRRFDFDRGALALLTITSLCCLLFLEIFMRWYIFSNNAWSYSQMKSIRHIGKSGMIQPAEYLDILWELRPNLNTQYKLWPFRTNSRGLRDQEYSLEKPPATFRVAVVGDSFTMAEGVPIEEAYHSLLETRFNESGDPLNYEFINFGVAGYSLVQYLATIRRKVFAYSPDVILLAFCAANDSKLPNLDAFKRPYQVKPEVNGFIHFYSLELLGDVYKKNYNWLRGRYSGDNADPVYVDEQFKELSAIVSAAQIPLIVAYIDNKAASTDLEMVRSSAERYGFEFIDATINFSKEISKSHIIYLTDRHPNGAANRVFADTLYPALRASPSFKESAD